MKEYRERIADRILDFKLEGKGAVLIEGAKWCGKTSTALNRASSVLYMQDPDQREQNLQMAELKPSNLLRGDTPRLIDEWQLAPKLWDAVRHEVDKRSELGQFILTGSAVPVDMKQIYHSGIGRITRMLMRPMSLAESDDSTKEVSLQAMFEGNTDIEGQNSIDIGRLAYLICRGGWPGAISLEEKIALSQAIDYYDATISSDISRLDNVNRDSTTAHSIMRAYARHVGSQARIPVILDDINSNGQNISDTTLNSYLSAFKKIFVIEESEAWNPNLRSKTAVRTSRTRYFTDPSIATSALGAGPVDLIDDLESMGLLFENLCIRDLRIYANALGGDVYHYRDKSDLECDAVIHLRNGSYGLVEVKLGGEKGLKEGKASLLKLKDKIDIKKMKAPAFMMILTGVTPYAYTDKDGVSVVPIGCLGL